MFANQAAEVLLNVPIRTLDAVRADKVDTRFLAGSSSIDTDNYLFLLKFHPESDELRHEASIMHNPGPVAQICTSPTDQSIVLTRAEDSNSATLWKIPQGIVESNDGGGRDNDDDDMLPSSSMDEVTKLMTEHKLVDMKWRGCGLDETEGGSGDVLTLDDSGTLTQWDVSLGTAESSRNITANTSESTWNLPARMAWDPHSADATAISSGSYVKLLDWRSNPSLTDGTVQSFQCHRYGVTDLDYNPNKPYVLATAGHDGLLKFWDLRSAKKPLLVSRGGHRHWVSQVSYNPFHDQLVLSVGTDSIVNLWRVSTISSAPLLTLDADDNSETSGPNVRVSRFEHQESCYALSWGAADAWAYASVGYDGKVALSQVPSKEKYKILL